VNRALWSVIVLLASYAMSAADAFEGQALLEQWSLLEHLRHADLGGGFGAATNEPTSALRDAQRLERGGNDTRRLVQHAECYRRGREGAVLQAMVHSPVYNAAVASSSASAAANNSSFASSSSSYASSAYAPDGQPWDYDPHLSAVIDDAFEETLRELGLDAFPALISPMTRTQHHIHTQTPSAQPQPAPQRSHASARVNLKDTVRLVRMQLVLARMLRRREARTRKRRLPAVMQWVHKSRGLWRKQHGEPPPAWETNGSSGAAVASSAGVDGGSAFELLARRVACQTVQHWWRRVLRARRLRVTGSLLLRRRGQRRLIEGVRALQATARAFLAQKQLRLDRSTRIRRNACARKIQGWLRFRCALRRGYRLARASGGFRPLACFPLQAVVACQVSSCTSVCVECVWCVCVCVSVVELS
jgi:hypothetical protein